MSKVGKVSKKAKKAKKKKVGGGKKKVSKRVVQSRQRARFDYEKLDMKNVVGWFQAIEADKDGKTVTASQKLHRVIVEEFFRSESYREVPKNTWVEMCGKVFTVVQSHAKLFGLPLDSGPVNLPRFLGALHRFFVDHSADLARLRDGEGGAAQLYREQIRLQSARAHAMELKIDEQMGKFVPREELDEYLGVICAAIKSAASMLQRSHGPEAFGVLEECLERVDTVIATKVDNGH